LISRDSWLNNNPSGTFFQPFSTFFQAGLSTVTHVDQAVDEMRLAKRGDTVFPAGGSDARVAEYVVSASRDLKEE